ncbi:hypothetical protein [Sulfitobacter sp. DSM 110093]|uniref:hypothetical protein n=1 Tax=Sulfitobacter sp. DSM 110093 TaxID=2883127 RepID=UPI001FAC571E|nr:hypothetical protein [Sulfitobacter sp. DSM 110093]
MERHGKRQDASSQARRVRDENALIWNTLDLREAREIHVDGVKQSGQTAALHILIQFPTALQPTDDKGQLQMLMHSVRFVQKFHGGRAVFAARLDRDEVGQHTVDVFAMPTYERTYKDGRTAWWASVSKFTKAEAKRRYGRDDKRAQGSALQDAWHEYLRDEIGLNALQPTRKKATARDRVEPEMYALRQEQNRVRAMAEHAQRLLSGIEKLAARVGRFLPELTGLRAGARELDEMTNTKKNERNNRWR